MWIPKISSQQLDVAISIIKSGSMEKYILETRFDLLIFNLHQSILFPESPLSNNWDIDLSI